jgi:hypothetical protein
VIRRMIWALVRPIVEWLALAEVSRIAATRRHNERGLAWNGEPETSDEHQSPHGHTDT